MYKALTALNKEKNNTILFLVDPQGHIFIRKLFNVATFDLKIIFGYIQKTSEDVKIAIKRLIIFMKPYISEPFVPPTQS